ncbi:hypothetical protein Esti_000537 [Eimeria stiedai]
MQLFFSSSPQIGTDFMLREVEISEKSLRRNPRSLSGEGTIYQSAPALPHSTFRDANWPPRCVQLQTRAERTRPASSQSGNHVMHVADGGKTQRNTVSLILLAMHKTRGSCAPSEYEMHHRKKHSPQRSRFECRTSEDRPKADRELLFVFASCQTQKIPQALENSDDDEERSSVSTAVPTDTRKHPIQASIAHPPDATPQQFRFSCIPPRFSGAFNECNFLNQQNQQVNKAREENLLGAFDGFFVDPQNHSHEYDVACRAEPHAQQDPTSAYGRSVGWNRGHSAAPNLTHAKATLDHAALPNALKMHQDPLQLNTSSSARVNAESPRTSAAREYQTQEIAELSRMATAIESLLSSTKKRTSKYDSPEELPVVGAAADLREDSPSSKRAANAEGTPPASSGKPLPEFASSAKQQNEATEGTSETSCPPAKRDASAVDQDSRFSERNEQNHRVGCRLSRELVKKPRVGVMTNVLLLICRYADHSLEESRQASRFISHQNKDYKAGRVRLHDWCRRNAGNLSPDQCASATANYFYLMCESDLVTPKPLVRLWTATIVKNLTGSFLHRGVAHNSLCCSSFNRLNDFLLGFSSTTLKPEFSEQNELRASCELQKGQSETRVPPKRRSSQANAETDEACAARQSEGAPAQEAPRAESNEACKHEEGVSMASRRSSKGPTAGQEQPEGPPSATPPTPHSTSQAKQHELRTTHCNQQTTRRVKPEIPREPPDDGQGNEERNKRQKRATDSTSTTGSSRHSLQNESEAYLYNGDLQSNRIAAAATHLTSQNADVRPQQTAKKPSHAAPAKRSPHCSIQDSLLSKQVQQSASSSTAQQNTHQMAQQNRAKKVGGGGNSQSAAHDQTRRYNTRSGGVIKKEGLHL